MAMPKHRFTLISYIVLQFISVYLQVNLLIKRSFAGHSPRLSFLSVSLYHIKKERKKKKRSIVRHSPRCNFLKVSLYGIMRTINVNYLLCIQN